MEIGGGVGNSAMGGDCQHMVKTVSLFMGLDNMKQKIADVNSYVSLAMLRQLNTNC